VAVFLPTDSVTEIIAHFIGYFRLEVEEARLRHPYDGFAQVPDRVDLPPEPAAPEPRFSPQLTVPSLSASVHYTPPDWGVVGHHQVSPLHLPHTFYVPMPAAAWEPVHQPLPDVPTIQFPAAAAVPLLAPPGAVVLELNQIVVLSDNDTVILGNPEGPIVLPTGGEAALAELAAHADSLAAPLTGLAGPASVGDIPAYVADAATAYHAIAQAPAGDGWTISASIGEDAAGLHVDGAAADSAPTLAQPAAPAPAAPVETSGSSVLTLTGDQPATIAVEAGGNALTNQAAIVSAGLTSTVLAVMGDYHQLDGIAQVNAFSDDDTLSMRGGALPTPAATTVAHNVASFVTQPADPGPTPYPGMFPPDWQISIVHGDLTIATWTTQYNFVTDQDVHVLAATGTSATITTGGNTGLNASLFTDYGQHFDLTIIGGSVYDANLVTQTNVLDDDDTVTGSASGATTVATGGNLLGNTASIVNVGATPTTGLPSPYAEAAGRLAAGDHAMPSGLPGQAAFEGLDALKVLYVTGNFYDFNYLSQTNVLGDQDFVALHQQQLLAATPAADWHIDTGANALINTASIIDYDGLAQAVHVGGQLYSDAVLIQAELVSPSTLPEPTHPAALANEAIAFLDHGPDLAPALDDIGHHVLHATADAPPADIMQGVLA
jgi:hypothetical protein